MMLLGNADDAVVTQRLHRGDMARQRLFEPELTHSVIGAFYEVYNHLGFGFLEHLYVMAMERELRARGHRVGREVAVRIMYKGEELGIQRLDMIVDEKLVVEVKSTPVLHKDAGRQVYNYLRATNLEVGILLHFGREARFSVQVCPVQTLTPPTKAQPKT